MYSKFKCEAFSEHRSLNMFFPRLLPSVLVLICFTTLASGATLLPNTEVDALEQIAKTLGKTNWDFKVDPCGWPSEENDNVTCTDNCFNSPTDCHIIMISLKEQNLQGTLPPELVKLPRLRVLDLTRNYLNGTIPREWGSMQLEIISLLGNRLTGSIPKEIGNISTLKELVVEFNQLSGPIPLEFGNLTRIERLLLTSNNFNGELPGTLANLTTLRQFRIGDNHFTGNIPNFIQNWTNLNQLFIQASGLNGPIPSGIALLTNLIDLRISDLKGTEQTFPDLSKIPNLKILILSSCNIIGPLPDYLSASKILDLSFNKLSGPIPTNFYALSKTDYIFLTGNLLAGPIPDWMLKRDEDIDLSYNNFAFGEPINCQQGVVNLFGSSSEGNKSGIVSCLRSFPCPKNWSSFHINCGGGEITVDRDTIYESDTDSGGASKFYQSKTNWAFSSTGHIVDNAFNSDIYIKTNDSSISVKNSTLSVDYSKLYMEARLSPLSLTYYGFCLVNGNYTVNLHFAEIMFTDDRTYRSLGRRVFDIYIQGKLERKDFNIEDEAGGVGKAIIRNFTAIPVTNSTLDIRFYWAGRGTTAIPNKGVYGPLISAISVDPEFEVPSENTQNSISAGTVVGIVAAVAFVIFLVLSVLWWKGYLQCKNRMEQGMKGLDLQTGSFTLRQIKVATNNFDDANKIGEGGFGSVYKGILSDSTIIAVKQLSSKSKQGSREFVNEIGMISALQHPHLVKLYGCCIEGNQLLLVYEYMENNSLARALFGPEECWLKLDWPTRHKICIGIARGLAYLHEESRLKIVHRDIKATNVLLDKDLNPKISDFGLAKLDEEENTHISTRIAGTYGYMAPEYAMRGYLTDKADVYSFGIVVLEIVSGRSNTSYRTKEDCFYLLDWALALKGKGNLMELVDPRLGSDFNKEEVLETINIALQCTNVLPAVRPTMSSVVSMLEGRAFVPEFVSDESVSSDKMKPKEMMNQLEHSHATNMTDSLIQSVLRDGPWTASTSTADLYPVTLDSGYWKNRD